MVPLAGIEPALLAESDFESDASTSSAIGAVVGRALGQRADISHRESGVNDAASLAAKKFAGS